MKSGSYMSEGAVYIGGCGGSMDTAESVASALSRFYYKEVVPFTFSFAIDNPEVIRKAVDSMDVITHGAGVMALENTFPAEIKAFEAPLPSSRLHIAAQAIAKTARLVIPGLQNTAELIDGVRLSSGSMIETLAHPIANLSQVGAIARFNSIKLAARAANRGISTSLVYMDNSNCYRPTYKQIDEMDAAGVSCMVIPGEHDELPLRPQAVVDLYFSSIH